MDKKALEKEFTDGLLTKKGFRLKMRDLEFSELENDFKQGYLTSEGYKIKKSKLELTYSKESVADLVEEGGPGECSSIVDSIGKPPASTQNKLLELFQKNTSESFNPSRTSSSLKPKLSLKKKKTSKNEITSKRFTVIDCGLDILSIPKEKAKLQLRSQERINQVSINECDTESEIKERIIRVFPQFKDKEVVYFVPTKCNDLFEAEEPPEGFDSWTGNAVFQMYASGTIYVRLAKKYQQVAEQDTVTKIQTVKPVSTKIQAVNPVSANVSYPAKWPTYEIDLEEVKRDIMDDDFLRLLQDESLYHCRDKTTDVPHTEIALQPGEFFLNINSIVLIWIKSLEAAAETVPVTVNHFVVMNEKTMAKYEQFSDNIADKNKGLLPSNSAIKAYFSKMGYTINEVTYFNSKFMILPPGYIIDDLCDWVMECRDTISSGQTLQI